MVRYDPHVWSSTFFAVRGSMLRVIAIRSAYITLIALALTAVHFFVLPLSVPGISGVHGVVGPALGLLLVFRTNASYERWWEGRKLWGSIVNTCRNLARQAVVHLDAAPARRDAVLRLTRAFPYATANVLRGKQWHDDALFLPDEATRPVARSHPAYAIATALTEQLKAGQREAGLSDYLFASLDADVHQLVDCVGACERIHKTPPPFAYVVHLRRALVIYCGTLPLVLLGTFGWTTALIVFFVSYILFGIEEIGVEIEDPFGHDENDLPLEQISEAIDRNVKALTHKEE